MSLFDINPEIDINVSKHNILLESYNLGQPLLLKNWTTKTCTIARMPVLVKSGNGEAEKIALLPSASGWILNVAVGIPGSSPSTVVFGISDPRSMKIVVDVVPGDFWLGTPAPPGTVHHEFTLDRVGFVSSSADALGSSYTPFELRIAAGNSPDICYWHLRFSKPG